MSPEVVKLKKILHHEKIIIAAIIFKRCTLMIENLVFFFSVLVKYNVRKKDLVVVKILTKGHKGIGTSPVALIDITLPSTYVRK